MTVLNLPCLILALHKYSHYKILFLAIYQVLINYRFKDCSDFKSLFPNSTLNENNNHCLIYFSKENLLISATIDFQNSTFTFISVQEKNNVAD